LNASNWWGVAYGVGAILLLTTAGVVVAAFSWMRTADVADPRAWTGELGGLDDDPSLVDEVEEFLHDLNHQGDR
jgi:hypothetical protein